MRIRMIFGLLVILACTANYSSHGQCLSGYDHDFDGICDSLDLDDDNDGILDVAEGKCIPVDIDFNMGTYSTTTNNLALRSQTDYVAAIGGAPCPLSGKDYINGYDYRGGKTFFTYYFPDTFSLYVDASGSIELPIYYFDNIKNKSGSYITSEPIVFNLITTTGSISGGFTLSSSEASQLDAGQWITKTLSYNYTPNSQVELVGIYSQLEANTDGFGSVFTPNTSEVYAMVFEDINTCVGSADNDGDGSPDYLDLDSDDDGCLDALEGSAHLSSSDLDVSGRITGSVDPDGVPTVVGSGQQSEYRTDETRMGYACMMECQSSIDCWSSAEGYYQVSSNQIVKYNPSYKTFDPLLNLSSGQVLAVDMSPVNTKVYGVVAQNGIYTLQTIATDGTFTSLGVNTGAQVGAAISDDHVFYIIDSAGELSYIDLTDPNLNQIQSSADFSGVRDIVYDQSTGSVVGISEDAWIKIYNVSSDFLSEIELFGPITQETGEFGASWIDSFGNILIYNNTSGHLYALPSGSATPRLLSASTAGLALNDGFNNQSMAPIIEFDCSDGVDDDGDGLADCADGDCDFDTSCIVEICGNGIDDDGDGLVDCADGDCSSVQSQCVEICGNGVDDDGDGLVDGYDPDCNVSTSYNAGLESSNRLADKIARRNYTRVLNSKWVAEYSPFSNSYAPQMMNTGRNLNIASCIPDSVMNYSTMDATPNDLIDLSNATQVAAVDYLDGNQRIGGIMAVKTENEVYEHSKYICDRMGGAVLEDVSYIRYRGQNLILYKITNMDGQKEVAVSLSAAITEKDSLVIENHWNTSDYIRADYFLNFQIWANSTAELSKLLLALDNKLAAILPIQKVQCGRAPLSFVTKGTYKNGVVELLIRNKSRAQSARIKGSYRQVEEGVLIPFEMDVDMDGEKEKKIKLNTGFIYDFGFELSDGLYTPDAIYISDGKWLMDDAHNGVRIKQCEIQAQQMDSMVLSEHCYLLEREVNVEADVRDYLNISRSISAKYEAVDMSQYDAVAAELAGKGTVDLVVVRKGITEWNKQQRVRIDLDAEPKNYFISLSQMQDNFQNPDVSDVIMLVFSIHGDGHDFKPKNIQIRNLRFTNLEDVAFTYRESELEVFPNPAKSILNIKAQQNFYAYRIVDALGKVWAQESGMDQSYLSLNIETLPSGVYQFVVTDGAASSRSVIFVKK